MAGLATLTKQINQLERDVLSLQGRPDKPSVSPKDFASALNDIGKKFVSLDRAIKSAQKEDSTVDIEKRLKELRQELINMLVNHRGGGNANRDVKLNSAIILRPFTDINIIPGSNVTITASSNQQTKYTDITISATGGGGGSGITRLIQSVAVDTTMGSTAAVDYVYLVSGTTTITLPTAVSNSNLYTIKNVGTGVVTVNTTSSQTIDGSLTITMPLQYTSVDIESDTANWNIT